MEHKRATTIVFGDGLKVTPQGRRIIRVDGTLVSASCPTMSEVTASVLASHTGGLYGYWRLGDGASPYLDSATYRPPGTQSASVVTPAGPPTPIAMTYDLTPGALVEEDDGAVGFNDPHITGTELSEYLVIPDPTPFHWNFAAASEYMTAMAWVKPTASTQSFTGQVIGNYNWGAFTPFGWRLGVNWPTRVPFFIRSADGGGSLSATGGSTLPTSWAHLAGVYASDGIHVYVNGVEAAHTAGSFNYGSSNAGMRVGAGANNVGAPYDFFYGGVDEVQVWGVPLSSTEIGSFYQAGLACAAANPTGTDGEVLTTLPDGTTSWEYPKLDSYVNGA